MITSTALGNALLATVVAFAPPAAAPADETPPPAEPSPEDFPTVAPAPLDVEPLRPIEREPEATSTLWGSAPDEADGGDATPVEDPRSNRGADSAPTVEGTSSPRDAGLRPPTGPDPKTVPLRYRVDIDVGWGGTMRSYDARYLALSNVPRLTGSSVGLRFDLPIGGQRVFLGGRVGYRFFDSDSDAQSLHQSLAFASVSMHEVVFAPRLAIRTIEGLDVTVHVLGGPSFARTTLSGGYSEAGYDVSFAEDRHITGFVGGTGGVSLYMPRKWFRKRGNAKVTAGVDLDMGFVWRAPIRWTPTRDLEDDAIPDQGPDMGRVALAPGFTTNIGIFLRFM